MYIRRNQSPWRTRSIQGLVISIPGSCANISYLYVWWISRITCCHCGISSKLNISFLSWVEALGGFVVVRAFDMCVCVCERERERERRGSNIFWERSMLKWIIESNVWSRNDEIQRNQYIFMFLLGCPLNLFMLAIRQLYMLQYFLAFNFFFCELIEKAQNSSVWLIYF